MDTRHISRCIIYTLLLVGNRKSLKSKLAARLSEGEFKIVDVMNSVDSLLNISGKKPDIALISLDSETIDSWEACYYLKGKLDVPVVFLGKDNSGEIWTRVIRAGAEHYIEEPFNVTVLEARLKAILRRYNKYR